LTIELITFRDFHNVSFTNYCTLFGCLVNDHCFVPIFLEENDSTLAVVAAGSNQILLFSFSTGRFIRAVRHFAGVEEEI